MSEHTRGERICELFCGAGGMGLGFSKHFEIANAVDIRREAIRTYGANHPETDTHQTDVRDLSGSLLDYEGITGVIGGPPCQSWSRRNIRQTPDDPRASLVGEYMRIVDEVRPRWFVLENVTTVPKDLKQSVSRHARDLGYTVQSACLNASEYGAAQTRRRWVVIGARDRSIGLITPQPHRTVRQAFATISDNWGIMRSSPETTERLTSATHDEWSPMNGKYRNMIRLRWDEPAPTVCNPKKVYMVHPGECRNISLAEAAALQGFPPGYIWQGSDSAIAQMIANAMPAEMAAAIAGAVVSP